MTPSPDRHLLEDFSRRRFLLAASCTAVGTLLAPSLAAAARSTNSDPGIGSAALGGSTGLHRLDGGWEFHRGPVRAISEVWHEKPDGTWRTAWLPHCFNAQDACDPDQPYYRGEGWYRARVATDNPFAGGRTLLQFQGAGQTTSVWVGTSLIGTHKGGYDEFAFDLTDALNRLRSDGANQTVPIAVCCDNSSDRDRVPSDLSDFCLYGGLYRHVNLVYLPPLSIEAVHVLPAVGTDGVARISTKARLYNPGNLDSSCTLSVQFIDSHGHLIHESRATMPPWSGMKELAEVEVASPDRWSPDSPNLYRCVVTLQASGSQSVMEERFGIRTIEFAEHGPFLLNGKRLMLRGTQRHADHAGVAAAMSDDQVREEMGLIKEMGANFVRLAHYQQDRLVLDLCDELGLMVWEEAPWCRAGVGDQAFQQNAKDTLSRMIDQHYNHPAIILWGLGNEDDWPGEYPSLDQKAIREFMVEMRDTARVLDPSRLTSFRRCDFARDIPDVYSPSLWAGWYRGNYREYEQSLETERERVKRFIHIEWGADSHAGRHSEDPEAVLRKVQTGTGTDERGLDYLKSGGDARVSRDGDWSETYACNLFDWHLKTQEKLDWLTGSAQWVFKDFASPLRDDNAIPRVNQKGVVERDLTKKESYFVFQSYWAQKPMVRIYGHSWPIRWGAVGQARPVHVYSNCEQAELFLNGHSLGTKVRDSQNFPAAGLRWDVPFTSGPNHLRANASQGGVTVTDEVSLTYQTEPWGKPATLRLVQLERHGDRTIVEATLFDARGVLCVDAANPIRFSVSGAGRLIDNLGTARGSREVQLANGRAQISLDANGKCSMMAVVKGLPAASLKI